MYVMVLSAYPSDKLLDVLKVYKKSMENLPPFVKIIGVFGNADIETGHKGYAIFEIDDAKAYEGLRDLTIRMMAFWQIPGYKYEITVVAEIENAIETLGIK